MSNPLVEVQKYGQSIWYDNIRRGIITSGKLQAMVDEDGLLGVTSNPAIFEKAIVGSHDYDQAIKALIAQGAGSATEIYENLGITDIQWAADVLHPVYQRTAGRDGYVSFEVSPYLAHDTEGTVRDARRLYAAIGRENVLIKVPGTPEGMPAITQIIADGISVNVTLLFSIDQYATCAEAYIQGLEKLIAHGGKPAKVASVASFFISRIDSLVDSKLEKLLATTTDAATRGRIEGLLGRIAVGNAKLAYARYQELVGAPRWKALAAKGAQSQRVLWASTSTKNPKYPKTKYVDELIAADTVNTIPEDTFAEYREHGHPRPALEEHFDAQVAEARATLASLEAVGISMKECTDALLADAVKKFCDPFDQLLGSIEKKRQILHAA
jgi:transaldolase / glucose-6-phosphate isomerase